MKTITPESAKELIDSLGEDDLDTIEILGKPFLIGNLLEKMKDKSMISIDDYIEKQERLLCLWSKCGYSRSIQEIVESGWEEKTEFIRPCIKCECGDECKKHNKKVLKPEVEALLKFIKELNLK